MEKYFKQSNNKLSGNFRLQMSTQYKKTFLSKEIFTNNLNSIRNVKNLFHICMLTLSGQTSLLVLLPDPDAEQAVA